MTGELPPDAKNVVGYATRISNLLIFGGVVTACVVVTRGLGYDKIKIRDIEIPLGYTAAIIGIGTLAHIFWAKIIILSLYHLVSAEERGDNVSMLQSLFNEIRTQNSLFLQGLRKRSDLVPGTSLIRQMSTADPTAWLSIGLALLTLLAILPWRIDHGLRWAEPKWLILANVAISLILVVINWWVGGLWIILLSRMMNGEDVRNEFHDYGVSFFGHTGVAVMDNWNTQASRSASGITVAVGILFFCHKARMVAMDNYRDAGSLDIDLSQRKIHCHEYVNR